MHVFFRNNRENVSQIENYGGDNTFFEKKKSRLCIQFDKYKFVHLKQNKKSQYCLCTERTFH